VDHREAGSDHRVVGADGQRPEATFLNSFREPGRFWQLANGLLDGDFPDSRRTDIDIWLVIEPVLDGVGERRIVG
jgi:hypothetical protein